MLHQSPSQGSHILIHAGDTITFQLSLDRPQPGRAWLRSNLLGAGIRKKEVIAAAEADAPPLDRDWFDTPMTRTGDTTFSITLPVCYVGTFYAKTLFLADEETEPSWPEGDNVTIKIEPASLKSGNSIYSAFTRLFVSSTDPVKNGQASAEQIATLDKAGYTVIPRSGKFRDLIKELDNIVNQMGFRNLLLLPVHPTPTTYARMGRFGSPFAALDLMDVDPALAEFDRKTTPLDQLRELIDATHAHGASILMDMPLNHTGWASALQIHHPSWFERDHTKRFLSPGAWGVTWEDLAALNYEDKGLWKYMAEVFLFWCKHGVDGFRCDAGYMIPAEVWQYITAKVRQQFPDTVFLLEGLGGKKETTRKLLSSSNLNWAYSEIFQNYDRTQIETYLAEADDISRHTGLLVNFAETHDNLRLAAESPAYSRMRTTLCALLAHQGAFGITCGVEWFATERIAVHELTDLNRNAPENQVDLIRRINIIINSHPAFSAQSSIQILHSGQANALAVLRKSSGSEASALILVNLDMHQSSDLQWKTISSLDPSACVDLLTLLPAVIESRNDMQSIQLQPGQALCLSSDSEYFLSEDQPPHLSKESDTQIARAKAIEVIQDCSPKFDWSNTSITDLAEQLIDNPGEFFAEHASSEGAHALTVWHWPEDIKRTVPVPAGSSILVLAPHSFDANLITENGIWARGKSIQGKTAHFTIFTRPDLLSGRAEVDIAVFTEGSTSRSRSPLLMLDAVSSRMHIRLSRSAKEVRTLDSSALCTNGRGAMSMVRGAWGEVRSQYDALLAGNIHPSAPSDRHVMLTRCRAWLVLRGYSQEINLDCLKHFTSKQPDIAEWALSIPTGMGRRVPLRVSLAMLQDQDCVDLHFARAEDSNCSDALDPETEVQLILRFDVEDRSFHTKTKAFTGPERSWPGMIEAQSKGFVFRPAHDRILSVNAESGSFTEEHEWSHMVAHPADEERGLGASTDLFSPGYFSINLKSGEAAVLHAGINSDGTEEHAVAPPPNLDTRRLSEVLTTAMSQYVVARDSSKTVIAGYPWFLDWGRDTLICLRGMMSCGMIDESRDIICQFASFEEHGTIPNMIRGTDVSNRDTSDAPLWMHVAASDLITLSGTDFLQTSCAGRSLSDVLISIAENYLAGTPNGIHVDPDSGLVFSPSHFTWMDTNHPAGTPREGYPIEIQALWFRALDLVGSITGDSKWTDLKEQVRHSIQRLYYSDSQGYLSDCLHCPPGTPAARATPDDHLRPNQLFAITLGALDDIDVCARIIDSCQTLLVPGAIRSLADKHVEFHLPVTRDGVTLNDPANPYWGHYSGDEDTQRKPAYHNGTAWTWPFPSYCEAMVMIQGRNSVSTAKSYLSGMLGLLQDNCIGQVPELLDGDTPHAEKGCSAQAWGISEFARVLALLEKIE